MGKIFSSMVSFLFPKRSAGPAIRNSADGAEEKDTPQRRWRLLQVESAFACNLRCVMCPWKEISRKAKNHGLMQPQVWAGIRPYLSEIRSIDFTGGGETLLQPHLEEWIAEAKAAGCATGFLSNGLLLDKARLQRILAAGLDWIGISMDGADADMYHKIRIGSNFDRVCENLNTVGVLRSGKIPKTMINFVLMPMNVHQVEEMVRLAARLGVDQVNFKQCDVIRGEHGKGLGLFRPQETAEIHRLKKSLHKAQRLAKKLGVDTLTFPFTPEQRPVCEQDPRDSMFVRYDGTVAPCISLAIGGPTTFLGRDVEMPTVHYGRLPTDDLMAVWQSDACKFYRQRFEQRSQKYRQTMVRRLVGASGANHERTLQAARDAMPQSPPGCDVCHYLYDI